MHHAALHLRLGKTVRDGRRQSRSAIAHYQMNPFRRKPTLDACREELRPGGAIFDRSHLIVQDLAPTIGPQPHHRQHHPFSVPHLLARVPALVDPGLARGDERLYPTPSTISTGGVSAIGS